MRDIVCGIMTSRKACDRRSWIEATWGRHLDHVYYSDHRNPFQNIVKVSGATHYKSNEEKHINFLNRCGPFLAGRYHWIFCCDDDTFVFPDRLRAFVDGNADPDCVYGTVHSLAKSPDNPVFKRVDPALHYPAGGAGYLISGPALKKLHPLKNYGTGYSDVSLGLNLTEKQIRLEDRDDIFFAQPPEHFRHAAGGDPRAVSYHYIKTREAVDELMKRCPAAPARAGSLRIPLSWWW